MDPYDEIGWLPKMKLGGSEKRNFATYQWADMIIFRMLWKWAKRRHPYKDAQWVKDRYFHRIGGRDWMFSSDGTTKHCLFTTASTPIRRHVKIQDEPTPFIPSGTNTLPHENLRKRPERSSNSFRRNSW